MDGIIIIIAIVLIIILIGNNSKKKKDRKRRRIDEAARREYSEQNRQGHWTQEPMTPQQILRKNAAEAPKRHDSNSMARPATAHSERYVETSHEKSVENHSVSHVGTTTLKPDGNSSENPFGNSTETHFETSSEKPSDNPSVNSTASEQPSETIMLELHPKPSKAESAAKKESSQISSDKAAGSSKDDIPVQFKPMEYIPVDNHENQSCLSK